jgi:hypothetical protein
MRLSIRRLLVTAGVVASLIAGAVSIQMAATWTAAAAPPAAPPVSIDSLREQLAAEQERSLALQSDLEALTSLTDELGVALDATGDQVSTDGMTAGELRSRLKAAQKKLASLTSLLKDAQARLVAMQEGIDDAKDTGKQPPAAPPGDDPSPPLTLAVSRVAGGVKVDWSTCSVSGFIGYAVVRSPKHEIHFPPEYPDQEIARVTSRSTTSLIDDAAPAGTLYYQVFCLVTKDGKAKSVVKTPLREVTVP